MYFFNAYKIQLILLLATVIIGFYTLFSISNSAKPAGTVITNEGIIISQVDKEPFTGQVVDTVADQIISFEVKNGLKNGDFSIYDLDGKKSITGQIINNKNDGKWFYYYSSGELESEGYFNNDVVVGEWIWYYPNGKMMEQGVYVNGKREGVWKLYNKDGSLRTTVFFNDGEIVKSFESKHPSAT